MQKKTNFHVQPILAFVAIAFLVFGLIGQGFELRRMRKSITKHEELSSPNLFTDKRNLKWYAMIGIGIAIWYASNMY